jgi:hypothetical protein
MVQHGQKAKEGEGISQGWEDGKGPRRGGSLVKLYQSFRQRRKWTSLGERTVHPQCEDMSISGCLPNSLQMVWIREVGRTLWKNQPKLVNRDKAKKAGTFFLRLQGPIQSCRAELCQGHWSAPGSIPTHLLGFSLSTKPTSSETMGSSTLGSNQHSMFPSHRKTSPSFCYDYVQQCVTGLKFPMQRGSSAAMQLSWWQMECRAHFIIYFTISECKTMTMTCEDDGTKPFVLEGKFSYPCSLFNPVWMECVSIKMA